ncbi:MAG: polysaccharide biosynthesis protein, partial [Pseudomonadales bacterium]|nr:polysaccharide biosynthesis protein [Pseudomonadales bacterium]
FKAASTAALLLALIIYLARTELLVPRTVVFNYWLILFVLIGGVRFLGRAFLIPNHSERWRSVLYRYVDRVDSRRSVVIYGAGSAGYQLFRHLQNDRDTKPVVFIDDDPDLRHRSIGGLRVHGPDELPLLIERFDIREIFLAIPSLPPVKRKEILETLEPLSLHVRTVPSIVEITTGRKQVAELQEVQPEDILGREIIAPDPTLMRRCIQDQTVMVTGAGGSIGSELCRQILEEEPKRLVLFEHSEFNLYSIEEELRASIQRRGLGIELYAVLGSVMDPPLLSSVMSSLEVNTIYHAAAYKHVPVVENNVAAGIRNNVFGTLHTAQSAIDAKVANFVLISTDKAVRPTNIMGASKRLAELILQALARLNAAEHTDSREAASTAEKTAQPHQTRFTMVRFGNVLDSSGSVIPTFRRQIEHNGPVTVTHPDVTRYFMTIPEAAQLVVQASSLGTGGEVFVLDMGQPVRILDLAMKMIRLSGLTVRNDVNPKGDIQIDYIGLRPGEKLYEELLIGELVYPTGHPRILRAEEAALDWGTIKALLSRLQDALAKGDLQCICSLLIEHVEGFQPSGPPVDWRYDPGGGDPDENQGNLIRLPIGRQ